MPQDNHTYGFNKADASDLVQLIGNGDREYTEGRVRGGQSNTRARLYRFTLNADLSSGTADADILLMDGTDTTIDADVLDPLGAFSSLSNTDAGLCLLQDGVYYVIQAPCPA